MEIILKKDITNLGYKNDLIKVKDGYARNYLIPKGMAIIATELTIGVKAGTSGKIFGSVNNIMVANAILEQKKMEIDRKAVILKEDHIKEIGKYKARVKLHKEVEVEIDLDVIAE